MAQIQRVWRVGDSTFDRYEDARYAATLCHKTELRNDLAHLLADNLNWSGVGDDLRYAVDAMLQKYDVTRRKSKA